MEAPHMKIYDIAQATALQMTRMNFTEFFNEDLRMEIAQ